MTPKEKAIKLYNKYMTMPYPTHTERAKQCALIAVDEIIDALKNNAANSASWKFYDEVKIEIQKL